MTSLIPMVFGFSSLTCYHGQTLDPYCWNYSLVNPHLDYPHCLLTNHSALIKALQWLFISYKVKSRSLAKEAAHRAAIQSVISVT